MSRPDPDEVAVWIVIVAVVALILYGAVAATMAGLRSYSEARERDACGHDGGKVDYYDTQHADLWRCVKPAERAP